jgi:predicted HicB family RNase H-like nuclease
MTTGPRVRKRITAAETKKHVAFAIPERLHKAAKMRAVQEGKSLRSIFLEVLEAIVQRGEKQ